MMNEHTKLLIMKAGGIICSTEATGHIDKIDYLHFDAEKFAELLIQECGQYLNSPEFIGRSDLDWAMVLNEHFGVEE